MTSVPVLIVGAGPTGLMMACQLHRFGIPFRIIDKKAEPTNTTNAAGIQSRTMEVFEQLGISERFLSQGLKANTLQMYAQDKLLADITMNTIDSLYPFILMLPQAKTERILLDYLSEVNVTVERAVTLTGFTQQNEVITATLQSADGKTETLKCNWLLGCDGYHSSVRDIAQLPMSGSDVNETFMVADIRIKPHYSPNAVSMVFGKGYLIGLFPIPEEQFRMVTNYQPTTQAKNSFSEDEIKKLLSDRTQGQCQVTEVVWSSPFHIHSKLASQFCNGHVFIAGDAAHVHSPAGAQGMNTGIQDATNLAWKIALVIKQQAHAKILSSYQLERYPMLRQLVSVTANVARIGLSKNALVTALRNFVFKRIAGKMKELQKKAVNRIAQVSIVYKNSPIILYDTKGYTGAYGPGHRLADVAFGDTSIYDLMKSPQHHLLLFSGVIPTDTTIQQFKSVCDWIAAQQFPLAPIIVSTVPTDFANSVLDERQVIHQYYGVKQPSMCMVRPDWYVGFFVGVVDVVEVQNYLRLLR